MPNPGNFKGARKAFIDSVEEQYAKAVKEGDVKEIRQDICRRYYLRFPFSKGDDYEPTQAELDAVDDKAPPGREANPEGWEMMTTEEQGAALREHGDFVRAKNAVGAQLTKYCKELKRLFFFFSYFQLANRPTPEIRLRSRQQGQC